MTPRFFIAQPLQRGAGFALPAGAARHVQVLRLQPGEAVTLFDGAGGEWPATVARMGRSEVDVDVGEHRAVDRELPFAMTLALGMPANERMDALVEKATELGVACVQPLMCERSVLRLQGDRALKKAAHWQAVAVAASEQSGRTRVPQVAAVRTLREWLAGLPGVDADAGAAHSTRVLLSLRDAQPLASLSFDSALTCLSGPEGGLSELEEAAAREHGFQAVSLGARVLRADTAPLALLAHLGCLAGR